MEEVCSGYDPARFFYMSIGRGNLSKISALFSKKLRFVDILIDRNIEKRKIFGFFWTKQKKNVTLPIRHLELNGITNFTVKST